MNNSEDLPMVFHQQADRKLVNFLFRQDQLNADARQKALEFLSPNDAWGQWVSRILLFLGASLVLAGIIYFFAFNWASLSTTLKFTMIQSAMIICLIGAYIKGLDALIGKILLLSASVLVGVFMAVFGQIYQTGADAYSLFMMWAIVIFGWTVLSNFTGQWVLWQVIMLVFIDLFWRQTGNLYQVQPAGAATISVVFCAVLLVCRETSYYLAGQNWLETRWSRMAPLVGMLGFTLIPVNLWLYNKQPETQMSGLCVVISLAAIVMSFIMYRRILRDMMALSVVILTAILVIESVVVYMIWRTAQDIFSLLVLAVMTIGLFLIGAMFLQKLATEHNENVENAGQG